LFRLCRFISARLLRQQQETIHVATLVDFFQFIIKIILKCNCSHTIVRMSTYTLLVASQKIREQIVKNAKRNGIEARVTLS
jgi:hypothetical protein